MSANTGLTALSDRQFEVLRELASLRDQPNQCSRSGCWATPRDFGGRDASHHSASAKRLVDMGLVERKQFGFSWSARGSYGYRITDAGIAMLAAREEEPA